MGPTKYICKFANFPQNEIAEHSPKNKTRDETPHAIGHHGDLNSRPGMADETQRYVTPSDPPSRKNSGPHIIIYSSVAREHLPGVSVRGLGFKSHWKTHFLSGSHPMFGIWWYRHLWPWSACCFCPVHIHQHIKMCTVTYYHPSAFGSDFSAHASRVPRKKNWTFMKLQKSKYTMYLQLAWLSYNGDFRLSPNFHRFVILRLFCDTPTYENIGPAILLMRQNIKSALDRPTFYRVLTFCLGQRS